MNSKGIVTNGFQSQRCFGLNTSKPCKALAWADRKKKTLKLIGNKQNKLHFELAIEKSDKLSKYSEYKFYASFSLQYDDGTQPRGCKDHAYSDKGRLLKLNPAVKGITSVDQNHDGSVFCAFPESCHSQQLSVQVEVELTYFTCCSDCHMPTTKTEGKDVAKLNLIVTFYCVAKSVSCHDFLQNCYGGTATSSEKHTNGTKEEQRNRETDEPSEATTSEDVRTNEVAGLVHLLVDAERAQEIYEYCQYSGIPIHGSDSGNCSVNVSSCRQVVQQFQQPAPKQRTVVVDGSNVARAWNPKVFSWELMHDCVKYFLNLGYRVKVFVPGPPRLVCKDPADQQIANELSLADSEGEKILSWTPWRNVGGKLLRPYDDRCRTIVDYATRIDGVIVSNDPYRNTAREKLEWKKTIDERRILFVVPDQNTIMFPGDQFGRDGPTLDQLLLMEPRNENDE